MSILSSHRPYLQCDRDGIHGKGCEWIQMMCLCTHGVRNWFPEGYTVSPIKQNSSGNPPFSMRTCIDPVCAGMGERVVSECVSK